MNNRNIFFTILLVVLFVGLLAFSSFGANESPKGTAECKGNDIEENKDIRETGPEGLKGLQGINELPEEQRDPLLEDVINDMLSFPSLYEYKKMSHLPHSYTFNTGQEFGSSRYDKPFIPASSAIDLAEYRAQMQPWYDKFLRNILPWIFFSAAFFFIYYKLLR